MSRAALVLALALVTGALTFALWPDRDPATPHAGIQATLVMRDALGEGHGFARALMPRSLAFPQDHGPHPDFRTEWWYYTGNLRTTAGRHVGFQLTFFRIALAPLPTEPAAARQPSAWATRQVVLAHFALTDTTGGRFHAARRSSRAALGLAGAQAQPFRVWVEDWSVEAEGPAALPVRLRAAEGPVAIDLQLATDKAAVLQGDRGLSRKGPEPGNASYYYSFTRMAARGSVRVGAETLDVSGHAWMDREWSTSALGPDVVGWDWFGMQLEDGRDLMFYLLRRRNATADAFSAGTLVAADGTTQRLGAADVIIETLASWTSPRSGVRYPGRWRVIVPSAGLRLEVSPRLADQELIVGTRYWEGAVAVGGSAAGRPISGQGYVELVGYGG